jgi:tRNA(Ile)-lysidine synthase
MAAAFFYDRHVRPSLAIDTTHLRPGLRVAVAVSGGADSVALLRALVDANLERGRELGLVLHVAHLHHGLRGAEADADLAFVRELAAQFGLPLHTERVDTAAAARPDPAAGKSGEGIEEAGRRLRYAWFRKLLDETPLDLVATAHTRDDQAETVLAKFLRGAWTGGLSGIHPVLEFPQGRIVRPLLESPRAAVEEYLCRLGQSWREDSSNRQLTFTRNRIRHELLPLLESLNPRLREHLAHIAELARAEESWWEGEASRLAPSILLGGRPVRGGGRAAGEGVAVEVRRLGEQPVSLQRRLLRLAAAELSASVDFRATESLRSMALQGRAGQKLELAHGLRAERTHRELRLTVAPAARSEADGTKVAPRFAVPVPGEIEAPVFGIRLRVEVPVGSGPGSESSTAVLRPWRAGDRVRVHHSSRPRKVKEVLDLMKVTGTSRLTWPVLEFGDRIVWMQGIELEPEPGIAVLATPLEA